MKNKIALILIFLCVQTCAANAVSAKKSQTVVIEPALQTLTVGEKIIFDVSWMGVPIGFGTLEVKEKTVMDGVEAFHVIAVAGSNEFLSKFCFVRDEIHSYLDAKTFLPIRFEKNIQEGRYQAHEKMIYDRAAGKAFYESVTNGSKKEISIPADAHDLISAFFWFRRQNVQAGDQFHLLVASDEKLWDVELNVHETQIREIRKHGEFAVIRVEPKTKLKGILASRGRADVYFSADAKRQPIWITLKTPFGPVQGVMKSDF